MNHHYSQRLIRLGTHASLALAVAGALALPLTAQAGSFQLPTDNAAGWARASAGGSLFANDPTAVYNNPAAMAFFTDPVLQITGTAIRPSAKFSGEFNDQQGNPVTGGNPNGFGEFQPFPNIAFAAPINDRLTLGASLTVPYGLASEYDPTWQGRYFGTKTSLESVALSFTAGFKVNDRFSLGLGVVGQRTETQLNTMLDPTGTASALVGAPVFGAPQSQDVQMNITLDKPIAYGYIVGAEFKPTPQDSIGFSYHSRIKQTLGGHYRLYGSEVGKDLIAMGPTAFPTAGLPSINPDGDSAQSVLDTPAFASLDWVHHVNDKFSLAASIKWTEWSSFNELVLTSQGNVLVALPQNYRDSFAYSVGGDYRVNERWTLRAGLGYDQTPTNDATRDPRIPDESRVLLGLGFGYQASNRLMLDFGYQHQFVKNAKVNMTNDISLGAGTMDGKFDDYGDVVSLTGTYRF